MSDRLLPGDLVMRDSDHSCTHLVTGDAYPEVSNTLMCVMRYDAGDSWVETRQSVMLTRRSDPEREMVIRCE